MAMLKSHSDASQTRANAVKVYPMTYEQEAMWLQEQVDVGPSRFLESWVYRLTGQLDVSAVEWALGEVVKRHEAMRTGLTVIDDQPVQVVSPDQDTRLRRRLSYVEDADAELSRLVRQPLNVTRSPARPTLLKLAEDDWVLVLQVHHTAVDDWALAVLDQEFGELYRARMAGIPAALEPLPLQMGQYAAAQRAAGVDPALLAHWRECLRNVPDESTVPGGRPRPTVLSAHGEQVRFQVDGETGRAVRRLARAARATPFTVLAAAVTGLLHRRTGADDLILGMPVSRRGAADLDPLIGCLTDLMPLRQRGVHGRSFAELIAMTGQRVRDMMAHANVPYSVLVREAGIGRDISKSPLCQTVLVVDDAPRVPLNLPLVSAERLYVHPGTAKFDLLLTLVIDGDGYQGFLDYSTDLYLKGTAQRVAAEFLGLLTAALGDPDSPVASLHA
jgi:hypothetical protein